jgi:hypothetical protein
MSPHSARSHRKLATSLTLLAAFSLLPTSAFADNLTEKAGTFVEVVSPKKYAASSSGTYYQPTAVETASWVFLLTQGGQFDAASSPPQVQYCRGDKIILWRAAKTVSGLNTFAPLRRLSPCHSTDTQRIHWTLGNFFVLQNTYYVFAERQEVVNGLQVDQEVWLWSGVLNAAGNDLVGAWFKVFEPGAGGPARINQLTMLADTTRTPPPDGFTHNYLRGWFRYNFSDVGEIRIDISQAHCPASFDLCSLVEIRSNGVWIPAVGGQITAQPTPVLSGFRPENIVERSGRKELWGTQLLSDQASVCLPCELGGFRAQYGHYEISSTFVLQNYGALFSQIRCSPADHQALRSGGDYLEVAGRRFLLTTHNEDDICSFPTNTFVGIDIVLTELL